MSHETRESLAPLLERLRLYNQVQRLLILSWLCERPCPVSELERETAIGQPALSQQLGELRRAGIIAARREAREVTYDFATPAEKLRAQIILSLLTYQPDIQNAPPQTLATGRAHIGAQFATILDD
ncbi:ArsR/SmtB family transcription factor [Asaia platycodi]|uniref:ArsR/SmtB family transcription factor n=1 Tax=Asaia platycodi TaxID=610243 RepID=UPI00046FA2FD|nr:ArsR family transcriptional regulator [Asaia platycodi]